MRFKLVHSNTKSAKSRVHIKCVTNEQPIPLPLTGHICNAVDIFPGVFSIGATDICDIIVYLSTR